MTDFMYILRYILESCPKYGEEFLIKAFLEPHYECFKYSYEFNAKGVIISRKPRHYTDRNQNETSRYVRIAIESVFEYSEKDNRNNKPDLTSSEEIDLHTLCEQIESNPNVDINKGLTIELVENIETRIIQSI